MARNRKRAKERRARRPQGAAVGAGRERLAANPDAAPDPIAHATPDAELAEAQLALGRPELADEDPDVAAEAELADEDGELDGGDPVAIGEPAGEPARTAPRLAVAERDAHAPVERQRAGSRLISFIQGSWRELQRVQWPDRRQVIQATGVVIGFVIVAGVYLGVADSLAGKLMTYILK